MTARPMGRARHRVAWGLLDQVVSSASNFVVIVLAARALSPGDFGAFVVAITVAVVTVALTRGLTSDVLASAHAADDDDQLRWAIRAAATTAGAASLVPAVLSGLLSLVVGETLAPALLVIAVLLPGLVLQDYLRFALIVRGQARDTFLNDLFWAVVQIPFLLFAIDRGSKSPGLLLAWGLAGVIAAALGLVQARTWFGGRAAVGEWLRRHIGMWPYYVLDGAVLQASSFGLVLVVSLTTSLADVGALRGAMTVYAPLMILGRGLAGVAVPELVRGRKDPRSVRRAALTISFLPMPLAGALAVLTQFVPDTVGRAFLGATWELTEPLLLLAVVTTAAGLFEVGAGVGIRALGAGREGLTARSVVTVLVLGCATVGSIRDGAHGVLVALALLAPVQMFVWWRLLVRGSRRRIAAEEPAEALVI